MEKKVGIIILFTAILLSGCTSVIPTSNQGTPTQFNTSSYPITFRYQRTCVEVEMTVTPNLLSEGAILLGDYLYIDGPHPFFFTTQNYVLQPIPDLPIGDMKFVSPDGKWIAYNITVEDDSRRYLGIGSFTSQPVKLIPHEAGWSNILYWLDNARIVVETGEYTEKVSGDGEVVINIFTGEMVNLDLSRLGTTVDFVDYPRFDPMLSRVVYFRDVDNKIVLLDWQTGGELWTLEINDQPAYLAPNWLPTEALPQWSADGTRFVLGGPVDNPDDLAHELLIVDRDGHIVQRTQFKASGFQEGMILQPRWSPDQRYIAFWYANSLTVFDTLAGIATDYCIAPTFATTSEPVWSMDSSQIAFENGVAYDAYPKRVIVLDIQENRAFEVAGNYSVLGWMTTSP